MELTEDKVYNQFLSGIVKEQETLEVGEVVRAVKSLNAILGEVGKAEINRSIEKVVIKGNLPEVEKILRNYGLPYTKSGMNWIKLLYSEILAWQAREGKRI